MSGAPGFGGRLDEIEADQRRVAVRALLARPLLTAENGSGESFAAVRKHSVALAAWFAQETGYRLVLEADFARLMKVVEPGRRVPRGLATRSGAPFPPRTYAVLCLLLASLESAGDQTTLAVLAEDVSLRSRELEGFHLDFDRATDRRGFVHAIQALVDLGVLRRLDGDEERYARGEAGGDALYRVHRRRLARLLAAPISPSRALDPDDLLRTEYPPTDEGRTRRARHGVFRRILEEAVVHLDDLGEEERAYFTGQRHRFLRQGEAMAGLSVEVRKEGIVAVDPSGTATDREFPGIGTVPHVALLVAERLAAARGAYLSLTEIAGMVGEMRADYGAFWSARFTETPGGREELAREAVELLEAFGLVEAAPGGCRGRPAISRFACNATPATGEGDDR